MSVTRLLGGTQGDPSPVSLTLRPLSPRGKSSRWSLDRVKDALQYGSGYRGVGRKPYLYRVSTSPLPHRRLRPYPVTIPTELSYRQSFHIMHTKYINIVLYPISEIKNSDQKWYGNDGGNKVK
jgi:hypothetical protein